MKIAMIRPGLGGAKSMDAMEPLAFSILYGLTPDEFEVTFYDESIEQIPTGIHADWIIMSANSFTIKRTYILAAIYRQQGMKVGLGGFHPTFAPEEALEYCDTVFIGDCEKIWPEFIDDLVVGCVKRRYESLHQPDISNVLYDERIFHGKRYNIVKPVQFGRGCKYNCDFCSISAFYGDSLRFRCIDRVVEEIKRRKLRYVFFVDDNLFVNKRMTKAFMEALIPLGIRWTCQISIDVAADDGLLNLMRQSGCISLLIGFETRNPDSLKEMNKVVNLNHLRYEDIIRKIKDYGMMVYGTFVVGYETDGMEAFDEALAFALDNKLFLANFNPLIPTIGAPLYDRLKMENRLLYDNGGWRTDTDMVIPSSFQIGCHRNS